MITVPKAAARITEILQPFDPIDRRKILDAVHVFLVVEDVHDHPTIEPLRCACGHIWLSHHHEDPSGVAGACAECSCGKFSQK